MDYTGIYINHKCGVYLVENPLGEVYIGSSRDIPGRVRRYKKGMDASGNLNKSIFRHGRNNHKFYLLLAFDKYVSEEVMVHFENLYIRQYKKDGYIVLNIYKASLGRGPKKGVFSVHTKGFYIDPCAIPT